MSGLEEQSQSDEMNSDKTSSTGTQQAQPEVEVAQEKLKAQLEQERLKVELARVKKEVGIQEKKLVAELAQTEKEIEIRGKKLETELARAELDAELQRTNLEAALWRAKLKRYVSHIGGALLVLIVILFVSYMLVKTYTAARSNERLDELETQVDLLRTPMPTISSQGIDEQTQTLVRKVALLENEIDSKLEASETSMEAIKDANDRIFILFVFLSGIGSFFGIATWYGGRQEQKEERSRDRTMFALQERNLEEINTITTAIASGATQNVDSLNAMLATFQQIMAFKVTEAVDAQKLMRQMQHELDELQRAQRQQVEELRRSAKKLRRSRFVCVSPDPDLQRQLIEFRTQMDLIQRVILDRYTGVKSPAENRRYGEIYLRRGIIAYYDNDMSKSREMLKIAEQFFPAGLEIENVSRGAKFSVAFTQFYLALIEKNYGDMSAAKEHIEKSYAIYGRNEPEELLTPATRAEILSHLGEMDNARSAIQDVLDRADNLREIGELQRHHTIYVLRARLLLGNTYYMRREWEQALEYYRDTLKEDKDQDNSYYVHYSIAQVYHQLGDEEKAKGHKCQAYEELVATHHLETKVALDTLMLLNALAYLCTYEDEPEEAKKYKEKVQELWLRIHEVNGLELRLFSFEKKKPVRKDEFWTEVFSG